MHEALPTPTQYLKPDVLEELVLKILNAPNIPDTEPREVTFFTANNCIGLVSSLLVI